MSAPRRPIRIEQRGAPVDNGYGTESGVWEPMWGGQTFWAEVEDMLPSRGERIAAGINVAMRPARVRMQYMNGVHSHMRIVLLDRDDRKMEIVTEPAEMGNAERLEFIVQNFPVTDGEP